ncbi:hypothetical protein [Halodesulfurarchaeum sp.]|uniref:hypothetical protein n=1 Tax=Halodesulfurarchaeum sp. TaxID=1980530 RepID=UPI001BBB6D7D|nr:hypothetical protein [Halodesulfurarchaeum sp.]
MSYTPDEKRAVLRAVASDLRGPEADSKTVQVAATVERVSDLYDPAEDRSPEDIFRDMHRIFQAVDADTEED